MACQPAVLVKRGGPISVANWTTLCLGFVGTPQVGKPDIVFVID